MKYATVGLLAVVLGCSSSGSKSGTGGSGGGGGTAGAAGAAGRTATGTGGASGGPGGGAGNSDAGITTDPTAGAVAVSLQHIALPGAPQRLAVDPMRNILYVMLSSAGSGGIVAVDTTTGNVLGQLAASGDAGSAGPFDVLAVDVDQNLVFGGKYPTITVFDGATRLSKSSIEISSVAPPGSALIMWGLAADNLAHRLYASYRSEVAVIDTSTATPSLVTTIDEFFAVWPTAPLYNDALALDTQNHRLFACGSDDGEPPAGVYDVIDTTQNMVIPKQASNSQSIFGFPVGCEALPGFGEFLVSFGGGKTGRPRLALLEPAHYIALAGTGPLASSVASNGTSYVNVSMIAAVGGAQRTLISGYDFCGGQLVAQQPTALLDPDPTGSYQLAVMRTIPLTPGNGADVYAVQVFDAPADGGTPPPALVRVHLPQAVFAAPADAGACP